MVLVDLNLDSTDQTGIDLMDRIELIFPMAFLVTDAFNDRSVQERAIRQRVRILPKPFIAQIAISV
jgi:hypothetical protein